MHFHTWDFPSRNAGGRGVGGSPDHSFRSADPGVHQSDILPPPQPSAASTRDGVGGGRAPDPATTVAPPLHRSQALTHETAHEPGRHVGHHCGQHAVEPWGAADQLPGREPGGFGVRRAGEPIHADPAAAAAAAADAPAAPAADAAATFPAAAPTAAQPTAAQPAAAPAAAPTAAAAAAAPAHAAPVAAFATPALARQRPSDDLPRPRHREPPAGLPAAAPVADTVPDTDSSATAGQYFLKTRSQRQADRRARGGRRGVHYPRRRPGRRCRPRRPTSQIPRSSEVSIRQAIRTTA